MEPKKSNVFECSAVVRWIEIELTSYCWMNCLVCARGDLESYNYLTLDNFRKIISLLKEKEYSEVMVCWLWDAFLHPRINEFMEILFEELPLINLFFMTKWQSIRDAHLKKIYDLKNRWYNVSLTFSVFSLSEKMYNYLTWWNYFKTFIRVLNKVEKMKINYSMEFMLSILTIKELDKFKSFANNLWKDYGISLVHNWWWSIGNKLHSKFFDNEILSKYYVKRKKIDICEVMKHDYLYINSKWEVMQCSLNEISRDWYLWKLWEMSLEDFLQKKKDIDYNKACRRCFYYNYKTFS